MSCEGNCGNCGSDDVEIDEIKNELENLRDDIKEIYVQLDRVKEQSDFNPDSYIG